MSYMKHMSFIAFHVNIHTDFIYETIDFFHTGNNAFSLSPTVLPQATARRPIPWSVVTSHAKTKRSHARARRQPIKEQNAASCS